MHISEMKKKKRKKRVLPVFHNLEKKSAADEIFSCGAYVSNREKSSKVTQKVFCFYLALRELHEDKLCDTLQAMVPINVKMVHQTSLLFIEGNLDRLGLDWTVIAYAGYPQPAFPATKRTNHACSTATAFHITIGVLASLAPTYHTVPCLVCGCQ